MVNRLSSEHPQTLPFRTIKKGLQTFLLFTILGMTLAYIWKTPANLQLILEKMEIRWLWLVLPLLALDFLLGGLRYRLFFDGKILPHISLWDCMRSNWANMFMGVVTPFQTGGGAAQMYILWRCGATLAQGALVSLINFAATLLFFQIAALLAYWILPGNLFGEHFTPVLQTGFMVVAGVTALVCSILGFPGFGLQLLQRLARILPHRPARLKQAALRLSEGLSHQIQDFGEDFSHILKQKKMTLLWTAIATNALFFNKYIIGYVLARALFPDVPFGSFIGIQILQLFLIYFAPTPGASGIAEFSSTWLMSPLLPEQILLVFTVAWRFFTTFFAAILGAVVLLLDIRKLGGLRGSYFP